MVTTKQLYRLADQIRDELVVLHGRRYRHLLERISHSSTQFSEVVQTCTRLSRSLDRRWLIAAESCHDRIQRDLYTLSHTINDLHRLSQDPKLNLPDVRTIYEELRQIQDEFDDFTFDMKANRLSIQTPPVELEGTYLGSFEIRLEITTLWKHASHSSYRVVARDPHPASSNEEVTHPHVSGEQLCEGEGAAAITTALHEGRLFDFFTLITSILNTYNPDSAYVALENWVSRSCDECGGAMSEDEVYTCQHCGEAFCESCSSYCPCCESTMCFGCLRRCAICRDSVCESCLSTCRECGRSICVSCKSENQPLCPDCQTEMEENPHDDSEQTNECECETRIEGNKAGENTGIESQNDREAASVSPQR